MDSFRDDGNVIHIIGGDDKPVSATGNEYDKASGGSTSNLSYGESIAIQKLLFKTKWCVEFGSGTCQNATNCNFAHRSSELRSLQENYEDFGLGNEYKHLLDKLTESLPQFGTVNYRSLKSKYRERTPVAPQPLPAAEADATVKPPNWRTRICKRWKYSGSCWYGSKCDFAHGEAGIVH